jgi:hypothetical protein
MRKVSFQVSERKRIFIEENHKDDEDSFYICCNYYKKQRVNEEAFIHILY